MTAAEILEDVKTQFQVLYLEDPQIQALVKQALRVCQNKIGPFAEITFDGGGVVDTPQDFASVALVTDANGRWQEVSRVMTPAIPATDTDPEVPATDQLQVIGYAANAAAAPSSIPVPMLFTTTYDAFYNTGRLQSTKAVAPFKLVYFLDLQKVDQLPSQVESLFYNYLMALMEIPNNQRARQVANTTGMQMEFPSDEELKQRKDAIETEMEEAQSIIPSAAVF